MCTRCKPPIIPHNCYKKHSPQTTKNDRRVRGSGVWVAGGLVAGLEFKVSRWYNWFRNMYMLNEHIAVIHILLTSSEQRQQQSYMTCKCFAISLQWCYFAATDFLHQKKHDGLSLTAPMPSKGREPTALTDKKRRTGWSCALYWTWGAWPK